MVLSIRASIFKNSELNFLTCHAGYFYSNKSALKNPVTLSKNEVGSKMLCQIISTITKVENNLKFYLTSSPNFSDSKLFAHTESFAAR